LGDVSVGAAGGANALAVLSTKALHGLGKEYLLANHAGQIQDIALIEGDDQVAILEFGAFLIVVFGQSFGFGEEKKVQFLIDVKRGVGQAAGARTRGLEVEMPADMQAPPVGAFDVGPEPAFFLRGEFFRFDGEDLPIHDLVDVKSLSGDLRNGDLQHGSRSF
jgi:hypothetical protein